MNIKERLLLFLGILFFVVLQIASIRSESLVFDEQLHVQAGYAFFTSANFAKEPYNPPLPRELTALPSVLFPHTLSDPLYFWQRMVVVGISCLFFVVLYIITRKMFGILPAVLAGVLYLFNPEILAHSHYAVTDLILSFFIFSVMLFILWKSNLTTKRMVIIGVCMGFALSSKVSALPFLLFSFSLLFIVESIKRKSVRFMFARRSIKNISIIFIITLISLWGTYFFTTESILGTFTPRNPIATALTQIPGVYYLLSEPVPLGGYLRTIKQILLYNYTSEYVKSAFLLGNFSSQGFWYYYPIAFLIKTPLPLLVLVIVMLFHKKRSSMYLFLPVIAIIGSSMLSTLNLGVRYILPVYPFIILFVSQIMKPTINFSKKYIVITLLLAWYIAGSLSEFPHFISYMNEVTLGKQNRHHFLIDSNYDWGQGLVQLSKYQQREQVSDMQLAYFGMVDPARYGLHYERIQDVSLGDRKKRTEFRGRKGSVVAISASCYYFCGFYAMKDFKNKNPDEIIGGSILLFRF